MSRTKFALLALFLVVSAESFAQAQLSVSPPAAAGPYRVAQTFHIGGAGGWDYLTVDSQKQAAVYPPRHPHDGR